MKVILALIVVLVGIGAGLGAGLMLKPAPEGGVNENAAPEAAKKEDVDETKDRAFVKIGKQTIVPVLRDGETHALMLFELAVDVPASESPRVHEMEPRLRDAFLRELFKLSHTGAFERDFTDDRVIEELRRNLTKAAKREIGAAVREVLVLDVMRQEL